MATTSRRSLKDRVLAVFGSRRQNKSVYSSCTDLPQEHEDFGSTHGMDSKTQPSLESSTQSGIQDTQYRSHVSGDESEINVQDEQCRNESSVVEDTRSPLTLLSSPKAAPDTADRTDILAIEDKSVETLNFSFGSVRTIEQIENVDYAMEGSCASQDLPPPPAVASCAAEKTDILVSERISCIITEAVSVEPENVDRVCEESKIEANEEKCIFMSEILPTNNLLLEEEPINMEGRMYQAEYANLCSIDNVAENFGKLKSDSHSNSSDGLEISPQHCCTDSVDIHLKSNRQEDVLDNLSIHTEENTLQREDTYTSAKNSTHSVQYADADEERPTLDQVCPDTCQCSGAPEVLCKPKDEVGSASSDLEQCQGLDVLDKDNLADNFSQDNQAESDQVSSIETAETVAASVKLVGSDSGSIADECGMVDVYKLTQKINHETRKLNKLFSRHKSRLLKIERLQNYLEQLKKEKDEMSRLLLGVDKETVALRHEANELRCTVTAVCDRSVANIGKETEARRLEPACYRRYSNIRTPADANNALVSVRNRIKALNDLEILIFRKQLVLNHMLPSMQKDKTPPPKVGQQVNAVPKSKKPDLPTCNLASRSNIVIEVVSEPDSWSEMVTHTDSPVTVSTLLTTSNDGTASVGHLPAAET